MPGPTVTEQLASWSLAFDAAPIAPVMRERIKLSLLDAIGCAWRARVSPITIPITAARSRAAGDGPYPLIGGTETAPLPWAVLVNSALIRALDFNDHLAIDPNDGERLGGHPSDVLAVALAAGEAGRRSGREVLDASLMGYELFGRAQRALGRNHAWDHVTVHGLTAPAIAGRLLGLDPESLADALSLGAAHATTPGVVRRGTLSSAKFLAAPMVLHAGVVSCLIAAAGATGPRAVFEDPEKGLIGPVYGASGLAALVAPMRGQPMIGGVTIKAYPGLDTAQALVAAVVDAQTAHGGPVDQIATLTLVLADNPMIRRQIAETRDAPANRETADHSLAYLAAVALVEGGVTEEQYSRELWTDPLIRDLMRRVSLTVDPRWERDAPGAYPCRAVITTAGGERFERSVAHAPGHARNPMDLTGVTAKFRANLAGLVPDARADEIVGSVMSIDDLSSIRDLTALLRG